MREIKVVYPLLYADRDRGNELIGLPRFLVPVLGKSDPEDNPLLTFLGSVDPHACPDVEVEITLKI
jgi:hypothetical protein